MINENHQETALNELLNRAGEVMGELALKNADVLLQSIKSEGAATADFKLLITTKEGKLNGKVSSSITLRKKDSTTVEFDVNQEELSFSGEEEEPENE